LPLILASGWASGLNSYATVLMLGLLGRFGHQAGVPPTLERSDVLVVMGALFLAQFVAGKIPFIDSIWDVVHTPIRVIMAGAIGAMISNHGHGSFSQAVIASAIAAGTALVSHGAKTGLRMGINASPEPVTNVVASLGEDGAVAGIMALAAAHPLAAAITALVVLVLTICAVGLLVRHIRAYRRRRR
ncbi:MAG: DUF4126 domain-containing protein, partial [Actinobacteria bacterium]|nr:DUF4126 domain-containing protein [Actinomycetota bacterium]